MPTAQSLLSAIAECRRCRGREHGDCSDECRHWALTASDGERVAQSEGRG